MSSTKRCAVIGAGASGLPTARWALEYGYETVVFEASHELGGLWNFKREETEFSTVAKSTIINTSKEMTAYSDEPPPAEDGNFMHNRKLKQYLINYGEKHGVISCVRLKHRVLNVERAADYEQTGRWKVTFTNSEGNEKTEIFDAVCVATGHHAYPHMAVFPGQEKFAGRIIHSHSYKDHRGFEDKTVIVVGIGNSGLDVACELSRVTKQVYLSTRRGAWIIQKTIKNGLPADFKNTRFNTYLNKTIPRLITSLRERECNRVMDHDIYGLRPKHSLVSQHPSMSDELPGRVSSGTVVVKGNIREFTKHTVIFDDGVEVPDVDEVVMATGYSFDFPYLDSGKLIPVENNNCKLYKRMFPLNSADKNTLAVIGLTQPLGSIMPISEMQARVFFAVQAGQTKLPSPENQKQETEFALQKMWKRYVKSPRHTIQVDYTTYMDELAEVIDVKPHLMEYLITDPQLYIRLLFGPQVSYSYRLRGIHAHPKAREMILGVEDRRIRATRHRDTGFYLTKQNSNISIWLFAAGLILFFFKLFH